MTLDPWFSRRYDGHDRQFLYPVSLPFSASDSPSLSLSLAPPPTFSSSSSSSSSFFFVRPGRERRQVGIRVAVNSPAPLSALMSLLLFALLNAIRAYSVSLPALPPSASPLSSTTPFVLFLLLLLLLVLFVFSRRGGFERHNTNVSLSRCVSVVVVVDKRVSL